jgi:hypothetical protein
MKCPRTMTQRAKSFSDVRQKRANADKMTQVVHHDVLYISL